MSSYTLSASWSTFKHTAPKASPVFPIRLLLSHNEYGTFPIKERRCGKKGRKAGRKIKTDPDPGEVNEDKSETNDKHKRE